MNKPSFLSISVELAAALTCALLATPSWAAPCCGGASAIPSLISGDDRAQVGATLADSEVIGDAPTHGPAIFRGDGDNEVSQTFRFDGALRFADDSWQVGLGVPLVHRSREFGTEQADRTGLGDVTADVAYEFLPELTYSPWKPKGFLFLDTTIPTSPSIYDAQAPYLVDARGRGFFAVGGGAAFFKTIHRFDFAFTAETHRSLSRRFRLQDGSHVTASPGWGGSFLLGAGYSPGEGKLRLGLSVSPVYEGPIEMTGDVNEKSASQLVWNVSAQAGYQITSEWTGSLIYTDQTLLGPARNVTLSRSLALFCQKRWQL